MKFNLKNTAMDLGIVAMVILIAWCMIWLTGIARADEWTDTQIVNAIYKAEGGSKATYLYGIRSVSYSDPEEARWICLNTVRNNRRRYAEYGYKKFDTYLQFLQSRYCPIGASNDPKGLNHFWLKNVKYFLKRR